MTPPASPEASGTPVVGPPVHRWRNALIVAGVMLALLMGALDNFVVLTALPNILTEFGQPNSGTFVVSAYVIASTTAVPIFAKLSDLWSRRNVFIGGLVIFIGGSILAGLSQNLSELILFRAVQGFGSGDFFPVGIAIVAVTFPPETRARITGLLSGVFGIATVAGPLLGSAIIDHATWRWVFYVNIPVGLVGLGIILATLGPLRPERTRPFDIPGAILLFGWVGALMFPLIQVSDAGWGWTDTRVLGLLILSVVLAVIFVLWELKTREPLVPLRLLSQRVVAASGGATFMIGMVFFPLATFLSLVVGLVLSGGVNAADTVRDVLYALVLPLVVGAALGGQLLTRVSYRTIVLIGVVLGLIGMVALTSLTPTTPTWKLAFGFLPVGGVILPLIPLGFGIGLTFPVFLLATQNQVAARDVGEAGGFIQFLQSLGGAIGLSILSSIQQLRFQALDPSPDPSCATTSPAIPACLPFLQKFPGAAVSSYDQVFAVMAGLLVVALLIGIFLQGRLPKGPHPMSPGAPP
ncbi:MAG: MFS transporter [Thermoplasmata archaeon]|nr:MFS transporter [Thermoplasmata archaeon]